MPDVIRCRSCGQANRVPALQPGKTAVCGKCREPLTAGCGVTELSDATFREAVASGRSVVDFWAAWCGPCRTIAPVIEELAGERSDIRFAKLNVDENPRTSTEFRVQGIPLLVFFKDGVESGRLTGAVPRSQIEEAIARYLG